MLPAIFAEKLTEFKTFLIRKYGNFLRAWYAMDRDANGRLSYHEFAVAARKVGFQGDLKLVFAALDKDRKEYVVLDELDPIAAKLLHEFSSVIHKNFGTARDAMFFALDKDQNAQIYYEVFRDALERIGFKGDARRLFTILDLDGNGFVTVEELEWALSKWHKSTYVRPDLDPRNWGLKVSQPVRSHGKRNRRPRGKFSESGNHHHDATHDTHFESQPGRACAKGIRVGVFGSAVRFAHQRNANNAIARRDDLGEFLRQKSQMGSKEHAQRTKRFDKYTDDVDHCFDGAKRHIEDFEFKPYFNSEGEGDMSLVMGFREQHGKVHGSEGQAALGKRMSPRGSRLAQQFSVGGDYTPWNIIPTGALKPHQEGRVATAPVSVRPDTGTSGMKSDRKVGNQETVDRFRQYFAPAREGYGAARGYGHMTAR